MQLQEMGRISGPGRPNICLGKASPTLASVCLTAPDKSGGFTHQTRQILDIIEGHLHDVGSTRQQLLMVQVWLADMADYDLFCSTWNDWIDHDHVPALSVVQAAASRRDSMVEIRAYAAR
jgi:enamine deaminase RidA (YjgF/YER057c/UK114 family)